MTVDLSAYAGEEMDIILNTARERPGGAARRSRRPAALGRAGNRPALSAIRMPVPLLDLQGQYRPLRDEILAAIARVCDSQRFIGGPEVEGFEREIARVPGRAARRRPVVRAPTRCSSR